jgi:hypothetical protein
LLLNYLWENAFRGDAQMAIKTPAARTPAFIDKAWLRARFAAMDARQGVVVDPSVTAAQVREMMLADGVRPEENELSREIIRMRYEEE